MIRLIDNAELNESRLKCKECKRHIAFSSEDVFSDGNDHNIFCPNCKHINTIKFANIDARNVIDEFKNLSTEDIKARLKEKALPFAILFENWEQDMNIGGVFRSANAFGAREVYYIGHKRFDRRGMQGIQNYTDIHHLKSIDELVALKNRYLIVAVDNITGAKSIEGHKYPTRPLFCFGSESSGLSKELVSIADECVFIPMRGSVRSLNCSVAAGIIMNDYVQKYGA